MSIGFYLFAAVIVLGPLIALHEWGHFWVARKLGVKVLTYSIGFGPVLWKKTAKDGVDYQLSAIPLGGYVRMLDEREGAVDEAEKHLAFNNQKPWKKIAIVAAGPLVNFLIAIVLFWILLLPKAEYLNTTIGAVNEQSPAANAELVIGDKITSINNKPVLTWQDVNLTLVDFIGETTDIPVTYERNGVVNETKIQVTQYLDDQSKSTIETLGIKTYKLPIKSTIFNIKENSAAANQGMLVGDTILRINNKPASSWYDMTEIIHKNPEVLLDIVVLRKGKEVALKVMPQGVKGKGNKQYGQLGIAPDTRNLSIPSEHKQIISYSPLEAGVKAVEKTYNLSLLTVSAMWKMLSGLIGIENLSGPISIAEGAGQSLNIGWQALLSYMALISVSLAVLNLLPIPVLDGGHIVYYTYEAIVGKPIPEKIQMIGLNIGLILMLMFMVIAISNDIIRHF